MKPQLNGVRELARSRWLFRRDLAAGLCPVPINSPCRVEARLVCDRGDDLAPISVK
ncbi:MAG TPA: hypothetical protein VL485_29695 [Ktedonobacteraceae bacterium]|nr:hypothetical protein [Ktedonobacteraceae bacterium]